MNTLLTVDNVAEAILGSRENDRPAILFGDEVVSYKELARRVDDLAGALLARGYSKGQRIGLMDDNTPFFVVSYLGVIRAGLCVVPLQVNLSQRSFEDIVRSTDMRLVLATPKYIKKIQNWAKDLRLEVLSDSPVELQDGTKIPSVYETTESADSAPVVFPKIEPRKDLASIMFTSGTTGEPKGVMVTHHNIATNTADIMSYLKIDESDRVMAVLPFYYCYGASLLHTHIAAGASIVLNNNFMFPEKVLDEMEVKACTGFAGVPSTYQILLRRTSFKNRQFPDLRWFQQAGGNLPVPFIQELREAFPQVTLFVMYGQTEATARLSYVPPELLDQKLGSIGKGLPSTRLEIVKKDDGTPVPPGSGEIGEVTASGDNITLGYWNDEYETAEYFKDGRLYTGDMGFVDEDGYIFLVDRERDFIKCLGHRVSAREIEDTIAENSQIVEVAVIGVPDDIYGEAVKAYIVPLTPGLLSEDEIKRFCNERLPNFKVPQFVSFVACIPKNDAGKVIKSKLKAMDQA